MHRFTGFFGVLLLVFGLGAAPARAQGDSELRGTYRGVLLHDNTNYYQLAAITLRTVNVGGTLRISANLKVYFGGWESNEFLTYDFDDVPLNLLTRQISMQDDAHDVSMVGFLRNGTISGDWYSRLVGRVGTFTAQKNGTPRPPQNGVLVTTLSGYYRGTVSTTNPQVNLPPRITMSFVTTQDIGGDEGPTLVVSGSARFYLGGFDSLEYVEVAFNDIQFNFYSRYLTAKTSEYGLTFKGTMARNGTFQGTVQSDGVGDVGRFVVARR